MKKVMIGMSGGVDSSVAAKLLKDDGFEVLGATLEMFDDAMIVPDKNLSCGFLSNVQDAKSAAQRIGIEHISMSLKDDFKKEVMDSFTESYLKGETPNPCIECNKRIKFGRMLESAMEMGFDYIATGHYAVREYDENIGKYILKRPVDRSKDQTYVLYGLTQYQLSKTLFPLGNYEKSQVRKIAEEAKLINSSKPDSQDICFVPNGDYAAFIEKNSGIKPASGDFVNNSGKIIGTHRGIIHYTVGQRRGIGVSFGAPMYVTGKDASLNTVTLGSEEELYKTEIKVRDVNLIFLDKIEDGMKVTVKTRYSRNEQSAHIFNDGNDIAVKFDSPHRAPAPGQAAVFYDGDAVIGGGIIKSS